MLNIDPEKKHPLQSILDRSILNPICQYTIAQANFSLREALTDYLRPSAKKVWRHREESGVVGRESRRHGCDVD